MIFKNKFSEVSKYNDGTLYIYYTLDEGFDEQSIDLIFSGDAQITLNIECLDALLKDISEPFESSSLNHPNHGN